MCSRLRIFLGYSISAFIKTTTTKWLKIVNPFSPEVAHRILKRYLRNGNVKLSRMA